MEKTKETIKNMYVTATNLMNKYILAHFYIGVITFVIALAQVYHYTDVLHQSFITEEFPFSVMVYLSAVMFIPALIWFLLTKYIKNIKRYITVIFFILFLCGEVILCDIMLILWAWRI